ncbi:hypothetical protein GCM10011594_36220 [Nakamurella endophytica]|uniref:DUF349 domain-containing protein n=1 Tax=Nakamurella endophytica TaxID=1748367 RepID=A0A917WLX2_9ACTN|nr:hypothetical protein GCM10011594_36220 [Nakamurella endophytica]
MQERADGTSIDQGPIADDGEVHPSAATPAAEAPDGAGDTPDLVEGTVGAGAPDSEDTGATGGAAVGGGTATDAGTDPVAEASVQTVVDIAADDSSGAGGSAADSSPAGPAGDPAVPDPRPDDPAPADLVVGEGETGAVAASDPGSSTDTAVPAAPDAQAAPVAGTSAEPTSAPVEVGTDADAGSTDVATGGTHVDAGGTHVDTVVPDADTAATDGGVATGTPGSDTAATDGGARDDASAATGISSDAGGEDLTAGAQASQAAPDATPGPHGSGESGHRDRGGRPSGPRQSGSGEQGHRPGDRPGRGPSGRPQPGGRGGRPGRPGVLPPRAPVAASGAPTVEPVVEPVDPHKWGRIDDDGVVYVYSSRGERPVGNWQAGDAEAGLAHFGRRFDDFVTEIALLETRLASGSGDPKATRAHAVELRDSVDTLAAVGDFDSAAARLEIVIGAAEAAVAGASQARAAARARAIAAKEALCAEAEALAESTAWKSTGDRLKEIVEEWRQIHGIDRKTDDALWKRFAKARDTFTRHRGTHFADLDKQRVAAKDAKEKLIARAEELSGSSEWGKTAGEYRTLMEQWKASGRAPREVEDQLWERFRAAQERFFSRRNKTFSDRDSEFEANAEVKERLLAEAERIDPAKGLDAARAQLRSVQERWEAAGKVPRERIREFDTRMRAVEDRVRRAEDSHWRRTDPETAARVNQFRARAESFRAQAAKARAAGDERKAQQAEAQAKQWEEWLGTAEGATRG